jgi:hypothetical protein
MSIIPDADPAPELCWFLRCPYCPKPTLLPVETLRRLTPNLAPSPTGTFLVVVGCSHCKHIARQTLPLSKAQNVRPDEGFRLLVWLQCDVETCKLQLPVFAGMKTMTTTHTVTFPITATPNSTTTPNPFGQWIWPPDGLRCPDEHEISMPV